MAPISIANVLYLCAVAARHFLPQMMIGIKNKARLMLTQPLIMPTLVKLIELSHETTPNGRPIVQAFLINVMNVKDSAVV